MMALNKKIDIPGLMHGDKAKCAKLVGCSLPFVYKVVDGLRDDTLGIIPLLQKMGEANLAIAKEAEKNKRS